MRADGAKIAQWSTLLAGITASGENPTSQRALEAMCAEMLASLSSPQEPVAVPAAKLLAIRDALAAGDVPEAYHVLYSIACPGFDSFTPWAGLETVASPVETVAAKAEAEGGAK